MTSASRALVSALTQVCLYECDSSCKGVVGWQPVMKEKLLGPCV